MVASPNRYDVGQIVRHICVKNEDSYYESSFRSIENWDGGESYGGMYGSDRIEFKKSKAELVKLVRGWQDEYRAIMEGALDLTSQLEV
tara:strand:- start:308 stop:571 length:264 start_codon:yes stop_codon:yes gene_type:complete